MNKVVWLIAIVLAILIVALVIIKLNEAKVQAAVDEEAQTAEFRQQAQDAYSSFSESGCTQNFENCIKWWQNYVAGGQKGITLNAGMFLGAFG